MTTPWFRFFLTYAPRFTLHKVRCPVLALYGEKDLQVPPKENAPAVYESLRAGGNKQVAVKVFPGLNHLFQHCQTGSPTEYARIEETFAPQVLQTIGDWLLQQIRR
ncbi:MAG: prolyl oligopeptidase family serine peptidase [bacterium]|nr:prolyl oligopeptidase family serine peptidase [bacterium]